MARASYQRIDDIRIGKRRVSQPALSFDDRATIKQIQSHLNCAAIATNATSADLSLTSAYRLLKLLTTARVVK